MGGSLGANLFTCFLNINIVAIFNFPSEFHTTSNFIGNDFTVEDGTEIMFLHYHAIDSLAAPSQNLNHFGYFRVEHDPPNNAVVCSGKAPPPPTSWSNPDKIIAREHAVSNPKSLPDTSYDDDLDESVAVKHADDCTANNFSDVDDSHDDDFHFKPFFSNPSMPTKCTLHDKKLKSDYVAPKGLRRRSVNS